MSTQIQGRQDRSESAWFMSEHAMQKPILLTLLALCSGIGLWFLWPRKGHRRSSDKRKMSRHEKQLYQYASKAKGKDPKNAARVLESIQMHREAIDLLESNGLIIDAAQILNRMGRPNRAGVLLRKYQKWKEASQAFEKANMLREAAEAAKNSGDIHRALRLYRTLNDKAEIADCLLDLGEFVEAVRVFVDVGDDERALSIYPTILQNHPTLEGLKFSKAELEMISAAIISGRVGIYLSKILIKEKYVIKVMSSLVRSGEVRKAIDICLMCPMDVGPDLMAQANLSRSENIHLANLFLGISNYELAGMVFERIEAFEEAGDAFANAEMYERAAYCFDRHGNGEKVTEMRILLASTGRVSPLPTSSMISENPFLLESTNHENDSQSLSLDESAVYAAGSTNQEFEWASEEGTQIIATDSIQQNRDLFADVGKLRASWLFATMDEVELRKISTIVTDVVWQPGEELAVKDGIYMIVEGEVTLLHEAAAGNLALSSQIKSGDVLGLLSWITDGYHLESYRAEGKTSALYLPAGALHNLVEASDEIGHKLYKQVTKKLLNHPDTPRERMAS